MEKEYKKGNIMAVNNVDWGDNGKFQRLSRKMQNSGSFSSLLKTNKAPSGRKNNNKDTGFVVKNGGGVGQKTISGLGGLHKTLVDRKVNLKSGSTMVGSKASGGAGTLKTQWVAKDGGTPSRAVVQAKSRSVKVKAERPER